MPLKRRAFEVMGVDRGERAGDRGDRGAVEPGHGAQRGAAAYLGGVGSEG